MGQKAKHIAILLKEKQRLNDEKYHRNKKNKKSFKKPKLTMDNFENALKQS